jgi:hypothetical protein
LREVPAAAACTNHLEREAIGICVECRSRVCAECVTKIDGINYCVRCLAVLAERGARREQAERRPTPRWLAHVSALALIALVTLLTWSLLAAAMPEGS